MAPSARRRLALKLTLSVLISAATVELLTRAWLLVQGRAYSAEHTVQAAREAALSTGALEGSERLLDTAHVLHPFTGWAPRDKYPQLAADLERFRSGEAARTYDILILGSSLAASFGSGAGARRMTEVARSASAVEGREVRLLPYGRSAYKQPQQLMLFAWLLSLGFEPDAVVCIDGFNEVALSLANARRGVPIQLPGWGQWGPLVTGLPAADARGRALVHDLEEARREVACVHSWLVERGLARSAVLGVFLRGRLVVAQERWQATAVELTQDLARRQTDHIVPDVEVSSTSPGEDERDAVIRRTVTLWKGSTRALLDLCRARGIPLLHVLQPNPLVSGSKPLSEEEQASMRARGEWVIAAREGIPRLRRACDELRVRGLESLDATLGFQDVQETVWKDAGHLNAAGNLHLGELVGAALRDVLSR